MRVVTACEVFARGKIFCHKLSWLKGVSDTRSGAKLLTAVRKDEGLAEEEKECLYFSGSELPEWLILCH